MINVGLAKVSFSKLKSNKSCPGKPWGGGGGVSPLSLTMGSVNSQFSCLAVLEWFVVGNKTFGP